ncbi:MAG: substrate-binding domain-containing protein [Chitinophagaceae bacterium]|nr:substrate-binding domain-containing protein [Rubrivivax sp.]
MAGGTPLLPPWHRRLPRGLNGWARSGPAFTVGLCLPMQGSAGIWGPSCLAAARLAEGELNRGNGIAGRPCELLLVDASAESPDVEATVTDLVAEREVDALVGMCISSVRERIVGAVGGHIPFVYTCLYEGGESTPGLFAIGETSSRQLRPSINWLNTHTSVRRWMLVGPDYIWPRVSHHIARRCIADLGGEVVGEVTVPFGSNDYTHVFDRLRQCGADAILISMVGQDAVEFNRAFARAGLARRVVRLSCAIEENQLLAIGAENTENLHVALGYFAALETDANLAFKERYTAHCGERAPALNSIGQSLYEGLHFLATLFGQPAGLADGLIAPHPPIAYPSARGAVYRGQGATLAPMYLARAEGHNFHVIARF